MRLGAQFQFGVALLMQRVQEVLLKVIAVRIIGIEHLFILLKGLFDQVALQGVPTGRDQIEKDIDFKDIDLKGDQFKGHVIILKVRVSCDLPDPHELAIDILEPFVL